MTKVNKRSFRPKITLSGIGQIVFTLKSVIKLSFKISPGLLVAVLVLNSLWGLTTVPGIYLEKLLIDRLVESIGVTDWLPVLRVIAVLILARVLLEFFRSFLSSTTGFLRSALSRYFSSELEIMMGEKINELDLATIEDPTFRDRFNKIDRESRRRAWGLMMPLSDIPNYVFGFISSLGLLVLLSPWVVLGIFIFSLPQFFISSRYIKKEYALNTELSPLYRLWGWISFYLTQNNNFMEMKILNLSGFLTKKLKSIQVDALGRDIALDKQRTFSRYIGDLPVTIFDSGISIWIAALVVMGRITIGSFQMYLRAITNAQSNLSGLVSSFLEIYENYIYVADLIWFLNLEPGIQKVGGIVTIPESMTISFKDVWFKYREDNPWILKGVDFSIRPGEKIAIVGENGAGKTTLIKLLGRFYDPNKGAILLDSADLSSVNARVWWKHLSILFQQFEVYPFSAKESIGYGDVERINDLEGIKVSAKKAGINKYIEGLPKGYDNALSPELEGGVRPSIGQWQRLGIARMLFRKKTNILILDEPTSNVDPEGEEAIFEELKKITKDKILIFITQRFSTVRIADRIFVMDNGKIIEQGTHEELMKEKGKYAKLFNLQALAYHQV